MGASAGSVAVDDGESTGIGVQWSRKALDDKDLLRDYGDQGVGGLLEEDLQEYQQTIEKIRVIEQVRKNVAHQRHSRLHARQVGSILLSGSSIPITKKDSSTSSVLSNGFTVPTASVQTDIISGVGTTIQTPLSPTPLSPAGTSAEMTIPPITSTSSSASSAITPQPPYQNSNTPSYTTITSYWASQTFRNNGTALSSTRTPASFKSTTSIATLDGTVVVFTYPTDTASSTDNSSTQSTTSSALSSSRSSSSNSTTTSTTSLATSLLSSATDVTSGGGGGYIAPTSYTATSTAPSSTSTSKSSSDSGPSVSPGLLGGVLGGVAGLAFVLIAILYMVRRHRKELAAQQRDDAGYGGPLGEGQADQMTQRSAIAPFALFARQSRPSPVSPSSETTPKETGFFKLSGRKLEPVIGGPRPGYDPARSAGESSVYPDDDGITVASIPTTAGPSRYSPMTATSASPTSLTTPMSFVTPSPAPIPHPPHIGPTMVTPPPRIPEEAAENDTEPIDDFPQPPQFPRQLSSVSVGSGKDGVGRSLPSRDGSRASRFTEDIV